MHVCVGVCARVCTLRAYVEWGFVLNLGAESSAESGPKQYLSPEIVR